jgi:hypothetical protein
MIPVKMTEKYMIDLIDPDFRLVQAQLCSFAAIDHKMGIVHKQHLGSLITVEGRGG